MGSSEQTKKSLEAARAALQAETREAVQVSRGLTNNLVEASRRIWRQLSFISVVVIVLVISYLAILEYRPMTTNLAETRYPGQENTRVQGETAKLPQVSRSPMTAVPESQNLLKILNQIRDAHYEKNIQLFMKAYSPTFPDLTKKRELTLRRWQQYDYLDLQFQVTGLQRKSATNISGIVAWNFKIRDLQDNEIKTLSKQYHVEFLKESGQWLIQKLEVLDNNETKEQS